MSLFASGDGESSMAELTFGFSVRPCAGETVSGDAAYVIDLADRLLAVVSDGLGHGEKAFQASKAIEEWLRAHPTCSVDSMIQDLHRELVGSVGAAIAICAIKKDNNGLEFAGAGNISSRIYGSVRRELVSQPGTLGIAIRTVSVHSDRLHRGDVLVLASDGVPSSVRLEDHPELLADEPIRSARSIVGRFGKRYDDASCLTVKCS